MSFCLDNHYVIADLTLVRLHGQPGLARFRLFPSVLIQLRPQPESRSLTMTDVSGTLEVQRSGQPASIMVGALTTPRGHGPYPFLRDHPIDCRPDLEVALDIHQMQAIENLRLGGDLTFHICLRIRCVDQKGKPYDCWDTQPLQVTQADWIRVLSETGYGRRILVEIPVPEAGASSELKKTVSSLIGAHDALRRGDWREAVGRCRDVLESLSLELNDGDDVDPVIKAIVGTTQNLSPDARLKAIRRVLKVYTHPAKHMDALSASVQWQRSDAVAIVSMVSALVQKCAPSP